MMLNRLNAVLVFAMSAGMAIVLAMPASAQSYSYTFDAGASDFMSNFSRNSGSGQTSWSYLPNSGISGSGAVKSPGANGTSAAYLQAIPNAPGTSATISIFGQFTALYPTGFNGYGPEGDAIGVGLTDTSTGYLSTGQETAGNNSVLSYFLRDAYDNGTTATPTGLELYTVSVAGTSNFTRHTSTNSSVITPGDWYDMTETFTVGNGTINYQMSFYDYGVNAAAAIPQSLYTESGTIVSPFTGGNLYAGIYGGTLGGGVAGADALDNFHLTVSAAAPEPPSLPLLLLGSLPIGAVAARCRFRRPVSQPEAEK